MVTLIHGDNTSAALERLLALKIDFEEVLTLHAKELTHVTLGESLASQGLFAAKKLVIVENPSGNKKLFDDITLPAETDLLVYEGKKLTSAEVLALQKKLPTLKLEEFKLDPVVFKFVESLKPGNHKEMLALWQEYIKSEEPEIALAMIARQIRLLLGGDDFDKLSPWQKQKISAQAKFFTEKQLIDFHTKLLKVDFNTKTGQTPLDLASSLELLLVSL